MKPNAYTLFARIFPGTIGVIPFLVLYFCAIRPLIGELVDKIFGLRIISDVTIPFVLFYLFIQLAKYLSKELYQKRMFKNGLTLPTTNFLLHLDTHFTKEFTDRIHKKILSDFGIRISNIKAELVDPIHHQKTICEAVSCICGKMKGGYLIGQHNTEYGFWRNLAGGSVISLVASIGNTVIFIWLYPDESAMYISIILGILYLIYLLFAKKLITHFGEEYAKILIREYMVN